MKVEREYSEELKRFTWRLDFTLAKKRYRIPGFENREQALDAYAELRLRSRTLRAGLPLREIPFTLGQLLQSREADQARKHQLAQLATFRGFVEFTGADLELRRLHKTHLNRWVDDLRRRDLANQTLITYLAYVMSVLNSVDNYFENFEWQPPRVEWPKAAPGRDRVLTSDEIAMLLAGFRADRQKGEHQKSVENRRHALDLFRLALLIPARESELMALTTADVNLDWKTVSVYSRKNNTRRVLPLCGTALEILRGRWPEQGQGKEFFPGFYAVLLIEALKRTAAISDVVYGDQVDGGWVFHDLRHTAATVMAEGNIDHATIATILGHKRQGVTNRYINPSRESLQKGIRVLENFCLGIEGFVEDLPAERLVSGF